MTSDIGDPWKEFQAVRSTLRDRLKPMVYEQGMLLQEMISL